jgi:hypothetical protein
MAIPMGIISWIYGNCQCGYIKSTVWPGALSTAKRFCDLCNILVHIGSGGEANWRMHKSSKKHQAQANKSEHDECRENVTGWAPAGVKKGQKRLKTMK